MTDDIIRKATTADYIETIDNLRAEVKRLRSQSVEQVFRRKNEQIASKDARIKELEAEAQEYHDKKEEALTLCAGQNRYIERLEAAFLEEYQRGCVMLSPNAAKEALERIKGGRKDESI